MTDRYLFKNIRGQKEAAGHLQNALRTGEISHAYIICGPRGSGKMQLAMSFAQTLLCTDRQEEEGLIEPCGKCPSCIRVQSSSQLDLVTLIPHRQTKSGAITVDDARWMRDDVQIKPYGSRWKVYIVPDADKMNIQAQNALLKTLEEPPQYAVILLVAETLETFLPTVLSRCITLRMHDVDLKLIEEKLLEEGIPEGQAHLAAMASHGNAGRAHAVADSPEYAVFRQEVIRLLERIAVTDTHTIIEKAGLCSGERFDDFIDLAQSWLRDIMVVRSTGRSDSLIFQDEEVYIKNAAGLVTWKQLQTAADAVDLALKRRRANGNEEQVLEMLMLSLRISLRRTGSIAPSAG